MPKSLPTSFETWLEDIRSEARGKLRRFDIGETNRNLIRRLRGWNTPESLTASVEGVSRPVSLEALCDASSHQERALRSMSHREAGKALGQLRTHLRKALVLVRETSSGSYIGRVRVGQSVVAPDEILRAMIDAVESTTQGQRLSATVVAKRPRHRAHYGISVLRLLRRLKFTHGEIADFVNYFGRWTDRKLTEEQVRKRLNQRSKKS